MDYANKWCTICGAPCGYCNHDECKRTEDELEALRIRQIYQGIEINPEKRTEK